MSHVNIMIATHDRWKLLRQSLKSLVNQTYKDFSVHVVVDGNPAMIPDWLKKARDKGNVDLIVTKDRKDVVSAYGRYTRTCKEGWLMNASDDLIYHPKCLSESVYEMTRRFPKSMGVIGINQLQNGVSRGRHYAFCLMNRKYIDHFPSRIIFCPDYIHYCSDMENGILAQTLRCFFYCQSAIVDHIRVNDNTTQLGLSVYKQDREIYRIRQNKGLLWGREFDLVRRTK